MELTQDSSRRLPHLLLLLLKRAEVASAVCWRGQKALQIHAEPIKPRDSACITAQHCVQVVESVLGRVMVVFIGIRSGSDYYHSSRNKSRGDVALESLNRGEEASF